MTTYTMVYSTQLQRNVGVLDPFLFDNDTSSSYFKYRNYSTVKNHFIFWQDIKPERAGDWGSTSTFKLPNLADKLGKILLDFSTSALTVGSVNGATHDPRFVDWLGLYAWEKIELIYGTNEIYTIYPDECIIRNKQMYDVHELDSIRTLQAGDKTTAERESLAAGTQRFYIELPFPHTRSTSRWMEIHQLAQEPKIEIKWRSLSNAIQISTALNPACTLTVNALRCQYVHLETDERNENTEIVESRSGITRLIEELKYEHLKVDNGTLANTEFRISLKNFKSSVKSFIFIVRNKAQVSPGVGQEPDYTNLLSISEWWLRDSSGIIFHPVDDRWQKYYLHPLKHKGPVGENIYEWSFAMEPDDTLNATGSLNLGNANNLELVLKFASNVTEELEVTAISKEFNLHQTNKGDQGKLLR